VSCMHSHSHVCCTYIRLRPYLLAQNPPEPCFGKGCSDTGVCYLTTDTNEEKCACLPGFPGSTCTSSSGSVSRRLLQIAGETCISTMVLEGIASNLSTGPSSQSFKRVRAEEIAISYWSHCKSKERKQEKTGKPREAQENKVLCQQMCMRTSPHPKKPVGHICTQVLTHARAHAHTFHWRYECIM